MSKKQTISNFLVKIGLSKNYFSNFLYKSSADLNSVSADHNTNA